MPLRLSVPSSSKSHEATIHNQELNEDRGTFQEKGRLGVAQIVGKLSSILGSIQHLSETDWFVRTYSEPMFELVELELILGDTREM